MTLMLSILIPSIPERALMLSLLLTELHKQREYCHTVHPTLGAVEIVFDNSEKFLDGGLSIGKKREHLVFQAQGKYLCFLDDDECISPNYLETLLRLCNLDKDVCTFRSIARLDNYWAVIDMGLKNENKECFPGIVLRKPWHICPVRSKFAKLFLFEDSNYGEDWAWFSKVLGYCYNEAKSEAIIHEYRHSSKTSESDKIVNYGEVGNS